MTRRDMSSGLVLGLFIGVSFFLNSSLHTYYVSYELDEPLRLGFPYAESLGIETKAQVGYGGAVVLFLMWVTIFLIFFPFGIVEQILSQQTATRLVISIIIAGLILHLSQLIGGASWTKLALDTGGILLTGFLLVLWHDPSGITVWNVTPTYLTLLFGLFTIGAVWINYQIRNQPRSKIELEQKTHAVGATTQFEHEPDTTASPVPPFASIAYFVISGGYLVMGSGLGVLYIGVIAS